MQIQIVEDDRALSDGILLALKEPDLSFVQNMNIRTAKDEFLTNKFDLLILDVNLPDGSGYDYLKWVREQSEVPVLILTANDMEIDEVMGLNLGADDYMTKPFSLAVLRARIKALLRRKIRENSSEYREDDFSFDFEKLDFHKGDTRLDLSINEQKLLRILMENKGRLLTREILTERIWDVEGAFVDENALSVTVNRLRNKLENKTDKVTYIQTVYGQGYMWKKKEVNS